MDKEIYIIRHGETELNKLGIVQGRGINSDLNDTGRSQAAAFYAMYKNVPFEKIYTSKLKRTHQTVQGFIDAGIPWEQVAGLDELAWGKWEGKPNDDNAITAFKAIVTAWDEGDYDAHFEGGESPNQVLARLKEAVDLIKSKKEEKLILICMHGRAMRLLLCLLMNKPLSEMGDFPHQNTTLYKVELTGDKFDIVEFNNTDHLK
ncbi:histidine phosphatase family protein [Pedobacter panaciterrae]|jgi:Fructose-2,6-bisphosphatase|uniref:Histidine phosphatase family protein n=1 Tax=Pedobacter panaciterrae TaxID=363849 RepID=A0ABU8NFG1_9SPHI|nr:histidine phosphatase family protein [Pedobacter panaciterrae]NQX56627.1 histidine phosphatase family protein [Pedobacter panaciterrae]